MQYRFLSTVKPTFYIRQRDYSKVGATSAMLVFLRMPKLVSSDGALRPSQQQLTACTLQQPGLVSAVQFDQPDDEFRVLAPVSLAI